MQEKGMPVSEIEKKLKYLLNGDLSFNSGKIVGSMCTAPHPLARKIFSKYLEKNVGDPGLFPATAKLEQEAVSILGKLLSCTSAYGYILTGGTEANILALWTAKTCAASGKNEILVPCSAHFSFDKAGEMLGLKIIKVDLDDNYQVNINKLKQKITKKTVALVGVAGSTSLGVVDNIPELSRIALKHNLYLHVDAAFGGFVLPFFKDIGHDNPCFDFSLPGVSSITIDPHKMGMSVIPAGGLIYRTQKLSEKVTIAVPYLSGGESHQATIVGTRSGASILATWALLKHLGRRGYREIVQHCMEITDILANAVVNIPGLYLTTRPVLNVVGISSKKVSLQKIALEIRKKGWAISLFPEHLRVVLMPHLTRKHIDLFIEDLKAIIKS